MESSQGVTRIDASALPQVEQLARLLRERPEVSAGGLWGSAQALVLAELVRHGTTTRPGTHGPGQAATRRPAAPRGGAPADDTGSLRVGWLQWIRRQLSADRAA